ncbi:ATP-binding protein [Zhongshania sp.]|uniref:sensor histidine kinase n=1 Tax=Zhongshania sp. TaxID=1971902 RepID=UPI00356288B4
MNNTFLNKLLGPEMPPHGHCYLWNEDLVRLHVISDVLISLSYFTIPIALIYLVRKRDDLKFNYIFVMFAIFIFACGATHLVNIFNVWYGAYWLSGGVKLITAIASVGTAIVVWPLIPKALAIPSNVQLIALNKKLRDEADENRRQKLQVERLTKDLEKLVDERTKELAETRVMKTLLEKNHASLERSNTALEEYARVTAHDIKEPLRSISVFGQLLSERLGKNLAEDESKWMQSMVGSAQRMTEMIDDLQQYCAPQSLVPAGPIALDDYVDRAVIEHDLAMKKHATELRRQPLGRVNMAPAPLYQLLTNLLDNAIKFSREQNPPLVEIGPLDDALPAEVGFYIRDNGIGIASHYHARMFGVFERLYQEGDYEGTGIGLAICRRIMDECEGRIEIHSEQGNGCEIRVYLPAAEY